MEWLHDSPRTSDVTRWARQRRALDRLDYGRHRMIVSTLLRRVADLIDPPIDVAPAKPSDPIQAPSCRNCGWDGKGDATPLLADLLEETHRDDLMPRCVP